jgi:hypothetical protein
LTKKVYILILRPERIYKIDPRTTVERPSNLGRTKMVVLGGRIFSAGNDDRRVVKEFLPETKTWSRFRSSQTILPISISELGSFTKVKGRPGGAV